MPKTWFTSDLHIGHRNIIKYCRRPWAKDFMAPTREETEEMDQALLLNWNNVVDADDDVYNLGDLAYCTTDSHALTILSLMNGRHHVVEGNHDFKDSDKKRPGIARRLNEKYPNLFASYTPGYLEIVVQGQTIVMCHYSMRSWHHDTRGVWHLYGHTHASLPTFGKSVDVGVDNMHTIVPGASFRPISFEELKTYMDTLPIGPHPVFEHYDPGHPEIVNLQVIGGSEHDQQEGS